MFQDLNFDGLKNTNGFLHFFLETELPSREKNWLYSILLYTYELQWPKTLLEPTLNPIFVVGIVGT